MNTATKKINPLWYLFLIANMLPIIAFIFGIWSFKSIAYFYWVECSAVAVLTLAIYARYLLVFIAFSIAIGIIVILANPLLSESLQSFAIFWSLYSIFWLAYIEIGRSGYGKRVKTLNPRQQFWIYFAFLAVAIVCCSLLTNFIEPEWQSHLSKFNFALTFLGMSIIVPTISIGMLKVIDMIGERHFVKFITGAYYNPVEKSHIVLFLDMVGSSAMAEKLEAKKSMQLIAQFIYDCGYLFRIHKGDILNYTGDGLVVMWTLNQADNALSSVYKLRAHFSSKQTRNSYWKKYGIVPDFRIGIHAGPVVLNQIGDEKLFIGLYGDVVNTAARLEQLNKQLETNILLSAEVARHLNQSWKSLLKPLGEKEIRGRDEKVTVYTLYQDIN